MFKGLLLIFFLFSCLYADPCRYSLITVGGGVMRPDDKRAGFMAEYKSTLPGTRFFRPQVGILTERFDSVYVYGGIAFDYHWMQRVVITPSFSPGLYFQNGGLRLGFPIEFRSAVEIAYLTKNNFRFGIQFFHLSNAHLSRRNPGVNSVFFFISVPFTEPHCKYSSR